MNPRLQAVSFTLAVVLLALLIAWVTNTSWLKLRQLNRNLTAIQSDGFHRSEHVSAGVHTLNALVLRFHLHPAPQAQNVFQKESDELKQWLQAHSASTTTAEGPWVDQLATALDAYVARCTSLLAERTQPRASGPSELDLASIENVAAPVLELCRRLQEAEHAALGEFVHASRRDLGFLQRLLFLSLFLLVSLAGVMLLRVYRETVAPLRAQLVETRASVEREEKLAALGTLAAGVAHEIRNPLTAINVRVHNLKRTLLAGSSEHEDATLIGQEIQRLDRIVRDFLHFARPPEMQLVPVPVDRLFARVQALLAPQWQDTAVRVTVEPTPPVWIRVDPQQMEQVLINLVQNAAQSIEGAGTVTLRARTSLGRLAGRSRPVVTLEVTDTGPGIPPAVQKRLFDPFFTTKDSGTGLGLPIAARIVEKHGGTLHYRTEPGRGTTFGVVLPRAEKGENENQA